MRAWSALVVPVAIGIRTTGCTASRPPSVVAFYGDSLMYEARHAVRREFSSGPMLIRSRPGKAPCDLLSLLRRDLERSRLRLVVLETVGNGATQCMDSNVALGTQSFQESFVDGVRGFARSTQRAGVPLLIVDPPPIGGLVAAQDRPLTALGRRLRTELGDEALVRFTSRPRESVSLDDAFSRTLPCLPSERDSTACRNGEITIRDPYLGVHFCPVTYANHAELVRGCPKYSSGAERFGRALAEAAQRELRRGTLDR